MQISGSAVAMSSTAKSRSASCMRYSSRSRYPERGMAPTPRHLRSPTSKTWVTTSRAAWLPPCDPARAYWFSTSARPASSCRTAIRMPSSRSSGSKPVITIGTRWRSQSSSYSPQPMMAHTWPGPRNACTRLSGDSRMAAMAGGTSTCDTSIEKLPRPCRRAWKTAIAFAGAVVSKPIPKKTTRRCGLSRAMRSASSGEYTTRTSAPLPFRVRRSPCDPGTRSMSPNDVKITSA